MTYSLNWSPYKEFFMRTYSFYKIAALTSLVFFNAQGSVQSMDDDGKACKGTGVKQESPREKEKRLASQAYDQAMEKLVQRDYDGAFRRFIYVAFSEVYTVEDFKKAEEGKDYAGPLLSSFGHHPTPPEEEIQRRHAAFGYAYTLWKTNGEGLNKESSIGKGMEECIADLSIVHLINFKCSETTRSHLRDDSMGWKLEF